MWQNRPVAEWSSEQVCLWLTAMSMDEYTSEFAAKGVDGTELLLLDGEKLKVRGKCSKHSKHFHLLIYKYRYYPKN